MFVDDNQVYGRVELCSHSVAFMDSFLAILNCMPWRVCPSSCAPDMTKMLGCAW